MKIENTEAQMRKGILELCVLSITDKEPVYPSDILKQLKACKLLVVEGTIYPLLNRLSKAQLLAYDWVESETGPPRKYYKTTDNGKEVLTHLKSHWEKLQSSVQQLVAN